DHDCNQHAYRLRQALSLPAPSPPVPSRCGLSLILPTSRNALCKTHSICPLTLRNSSAAHFSSAFIVAASIRNANGFFSAIINDLESPCSLSAACPCPHTTPPSDCSPSPPSFLHPAR